MKKIAIDKQKLWLYTRNFALSYLGALLANALSLPIPWLLGALLTTLLLGQYGFNMNAPKVCRQGGILVIAVGLGLYFNADMVALLLSHIGLFLFTAIFSLCLCALGACLLCRFSKTDFTTAWLASAVGAASQMPHLAAELGGAVDKVVSAHSLRVLTVAIFVPFLYRYLGLEGNVEDTVIASLPVHYPQFALLLVIASIGALLFKRLGVINPWTFGPLIVTAVLTYLGFTFSAVPDTVSHIAQALIGWSVGSKFSQGFFRHAPKFLLVVFVSVSSCLLLTLGVTYFLSWVSAFDLASLGLGLVPGGVAEMTITSKVLHLNVALVTALHVVRMLTVIGTAPFLLSVVNRFLAKNQKENK